MVQLMEKQHLFPDFPYQSSVPILIASLLVQVRSEAIYIYVLQISDVTRKPKDGCKLDI